MSQSPPHPAPTDSGPAWEVATLFPQQGDWSESEYLSLTDDTNRLVEFTDGRIEILRMPTPLHQRILAHLFLQFQGFATQHDIGEVLFAALRVRISETRFREPDLVVVLNEHRHLIGERYWMGADLVVEVVSEDAESRDRDWKQKRIEYAEAGIPEYWIVDPHQQRLLVLRLEDDKYVTHAEAGATGDVVSALLDGFNVDAAEVWKAGQPTQ